VCAGIFWVGESDVTKTTGQCYLVTVNIDYGVINIYWMVLDAREIFFSKRRCHQKKSGEGESESAKYEEELPVVVVAHMRAV
jgi:hypothetical protein